MKRYELHRQQAKQIMEMCNPLGIVDVNKRLCVYDGVVKCYEMALNKMYNMFPRGWIEVPYCMQRLQGVSLADAEMACGYRDKAVITWDCGNSVELRYKRSESIKGIFVRMLKMTGCNFSEDALRKALFDFDAMLEQQKYYDRDYETEKTNIKFV